MPSLLTELTALLAFWLFLGAWQRDRNTRGRRLFLAQCGAVFVWCTARLGAIHGVLAQPQVDQLSYLAILPLPALWLALALVVRGAPIARRAPWGLGVLLAPGAACYVLLFQERDLAAWFIAHDGDAGFALGPLFWVHAGWAWALGMLGSWHFLKSAASLRSRRERAARVLTALLSTTPMIANAIYLAVGLPGIDPTPILVTACLVAVRSELFSGDLLQALPVSQHDLLSQLPRPLIVTDPTGRVTEINPAAEACLAVARADALDRNVESLLEEARFAPAFERWPLVAHGREAGFAFLPQRTSLGREEAA